MSAVIPDPRPSRIPAVRLDAHGRRHVDLGAVAAIAAPLMLNSAVQLLLNLTDTWFIGRLSTDAMAAMGATNFLAIVGLLAIGGVGLCVQTLVAQAYGARSSLRASRAVWLGLWAALITAPVFVGVALAAPWLFAPFGLALPVEAAASDYWMPRLIGGPLSVALWSLSGFFNGIGRTRVTFLVMLLVAVLNAVLNEVLIFRLDLGIAGSGWATTLSVGAGAALAAALFLSAPLQRPYRTRLTWRPSARGLRRVFGLGVPTGIFPAVDLVAIALFQIMQVRIGAIEGAATQIVMMLTSLAYMPAIGIAMAGTTLVGQSIGAGDKAWAARMGNATILLVTVYMGTVGVIIGVGGPWLVPLFVDTADPHGRDVIALGLTLVWIGGAYQLFDGINLASAFCLRGAGDVKVPTRYLMLLAWGAFVPLAHMFSFARGEGWVEFLPQFGWGAAGGWTAALLYIVALGVMMGLRWRSGAWQHIKLT